MQGLAGGSAGSEGDCWLKTELDTTGTPEAGRAGGGVSAAFRADAQYCHSDEASWASVVGCWALLLFYVGGGVVMGARQVLLLLLLLHCCYCCCYCC